MIGPVSGTGRAMMASLQQAIQKGMPPDQAIQYVKSMATQGVAPLADLYAMMNQFQRLKQPQAQPPQTPPTIRDQLNMMDQVQRMQSGIAGVQNMPAESMNRGLGAIDAGSMERPAFAGGGIVAFANGMEVDSESSTDIDPIENRLLREYVPDFDTLPTSQQNVIRERLAPQIAAAKTAATRGTVKASESAVPISAKIPSLAEQREAAARRAARPVQGYEAEIAAKAAAAGEGEAAKLMREKLEKRIGSLGESDKQAKGIALTQLGAQIMEAASRPGATALGSIGAGLSKGLPMFQELQQRQQDLRDRYDQRMYELQQADELRRSGYYKEARALQTQAQADLRSIERASAENEAEMDRVRYSERAATERTRIQEFGEERRAAARAATNAANLDRFITAKLIDKQAEWDKYVSNAPEGYREAKTLLKSKTATREQKDAAQQKINSILLDEKNKLSALFSATGGAGTEIDFSTAYPQG